ncbi:sigma-70 family RNA polymerase sigma factor [Streptomyces griseoviridis]
MHDADGRDGRGDREDLDGGGGQGDRDPDSAGHGDGRAGHGGHRGRDGDAFDGAPQVPSQGGRGGQSRGDGPHGDVPDSGAPDSGAPGGDEPVGDEPVGDEPVGSASFVEETVPAQRDRREDGSVLPPPRELPPADAELIGRMRAGDDSAYEELYRRHADAVRRYARTCCRDADTADDLTAEVFAAMLQAVRGGSGPEQAVRAYLLTSVRRVAARWTKSARREQLVDDFAVFADQAAGSEAADDDTLGLGADVRALHEAERSMAMRAFRSLPERWQAVLWHTEVEDESPSEVAPLFGLDANGTRVLASRAREGLKQAYLQAHVSATLAGDAECARYADRLGAYARGGLRTRAELGLRKHLDECARCQLAAGEIKEVASGIPAVVPVAVIGWFGAAGYAKAAVFLAGGAGAGAAGAAGAAAAATGKASGGAAAAGKAASGAAATGKAAKGAATAGKAAKGAASAGKAAKGAATAGKAAEGLGTPAKVGIAVGVLAVTAAVAFALTGDETPVRKADAKPPASAPVVRDTPSPSEPTPTPTPAPPTKGPASAPPVIAPSPAPKPKPRPTPTPTPTPSPSPSPSPSSKPTPTPTPSPTPPPLPAPAPAVYQWNELSYNLTGDGSAPEMRLGESSWVWQRYGVSIGGRRYDHGVTVRGLSSVTIDLNRPCSAYDALVGVDDLALGVGRVTFSVYADGERLWRSGEIRAGEAGVAVRVGLSGRKTVRLVVEPGVPFSALTPVDWAESKFTCS